MTAGRSIRRSPSGPRGPGCTALAISTHISVGTTSQTESVTDTGFTFSTFGALFVVVATEGYRFTVA